MSAASPANFEALEAQARTLLAVFIAAGYEAVAPDVIQPAGVFLDVVGEALRGRTYVFTDMDGKELCLRPDLTVPTCRLYLQRHPRRRPRGLLQLQRAGLPLSTGECGRLPPARVPPGRHRSLRRQGCRGSGRAHAGAGAARAAAGGPARVEAAHRRRGAVRRAAALSRHPGALATPAAPPVPAPRGVSRRAQAAVDQSGAIGRRFPARSHRGARSGRCGQGGRPRRRAPRAGQHRAHRRAHGGRDRRGAARHSSRRQGTAAQARGCGADRRLREDQGHGAAGNARVTQARWQAEPRASPRRSTRTSGAACC